MCEFFLRNELPSLLEDFPLMVRVMYFQHDRAALHYTRHVREYLNKFFPDHSLGCGGPLAWLSRSSDLVSLDYYLWGHIKALMYETRVDSRAVAPL